MNKQIEKYYNATKFKFSKDYQKILEEEMPLTWRKVFYKTYPRFPKKTIKISKKNWNLISSLNKRESIREYSEKAISFSDLSNIIFWSVGIKDRMKEVPTRMYPSAGARYPIELYVISNNIQSLERGIYHFNVKENSLEFLFDKDLRKNMKQIFNSEMGETSASILCLKGVLSRTEVKYEANAYRFALLEAGHIAQNIYLVSQNLKVGCCAIGGFDNDKLTKLLDLTGSEVPLYALTIGKNKK